MINQEKNQIFQPDWVQDVVIRNLEQKDLPALEWDGEFSRFRKVYFQSFKRARKGAAVLWVAEINSIGLIGQVFVQLRSLIKKELADGKQRAYLHSFRVRKEYQNAGIGGRMLHWVEDDLMKRGYQEGTLNVAKKNYGAQRFYKRFGYNIILSDPGRWSYYDEKNILRHVNEPSWRMIKYFDLAS